MESTVTSAVVWWGARRRHYNVGLLKAGILALLAYVFVSCTLLPEDATVSETLVSLFFQAIVYFVVGNFCYSIGPLSESVMRPTDPERYRNICYRLGFWFSVLLPFTIPALLAFLAIFDPSYLRQSR
jgi:hypothetical protein